MKDLTPSPVGKLQFKTGVAAAEVSLGSNGASLVVKINGTSDQVTLNGFLNQDDPANLSNPLQQIRFSDGATWDVATILARLHAGTSATDTIGGTFNADTITGQGGNDYLRGQGGNDTLDGDAGADYAYGGDGDDVVRGGTENDWLYGDAGNDLIEGGAGSDWMFGGLGNDTLDGGAGADLLHGEKGNDIFVFGAGYGIDTVRENDTTAGNADVARFMAGIANDQIWFRHVGNNLEASLIGTADKLVVENWYLGSAYRVEQFMTADGRQLAGDQIETLVQAMAAFTPPALGQTTLPANYQTALADVIGVSWVMA